MDEMGDPAPLPAANVLRCERKQKDCFMNLDMSDKDLLDLAMRHLGADAEALMRRYYGSPQDMQEELEEFHSTGQLQAGFAQLLRRELARLQSPAE
jgi:hypothetical protein